MVYMLYEGNPGLTSTPVKSVMTTEHQAVTGTGSSFQEGTFSVSTPSSGGTTYVYKDTEYKTPEAVKEAIRENIMATPAIQGILATQASNAIPTPAVTQSAASAASTSQPAQPADTGWGWLLLAGAAAYFIFGGNK